MSPNIYDYSTQIVQAYHKQVAQSISQIMKWCSGFLLFCFFIFIFIALISQTIIYCIKSFGVYKIAKNRNFSSPFLSWIPFGRSYILGQINDDINKQKNINSSGRLILLLLSIARSILGLITCILLLIFVFYLSDFCIQVSDILASQNVPIDQAYWIQLAKSKLWLIDYITLMYIIYASLNFMFKIFCCIYSNNIFKEYVPRMSTPMCVLLVLSSFIIPSPIVDSVIFFSISSNEPQSLSQQIYI